MTLTHDEITKNNPRKAQTYNNYHTWHVDEVYNATERTPLVPRPKRKRFFQQMSPRWIPGEIEDEKEINQIRLPSNDDVIENGNRPLHNNGYHRGFRRRFFLFLTEPHSSLGSAAFFFILIFAIFVSNVIMVLQTMDSFQYTPPDCHICGGESTYMFDDDLGTVSATSRANHGCICPPEPFDYLNQILDYLLYFFAVEWTLRVLSYVPANPRPGLLAHIKDWFDYLTEASTLIDALAIWPYFFEALPKGLVSLRLLRLFRVFQLVRLGQYNVMFISLTNVLQKSLEYLKLMCLVLLFGAACFGSLLFWLEQGTWKYWEPTGSFEYIRMSVDGVNEEISPFKSIPASFWWFLVTATTVGYGDYYPTSMVGQWVAVFAMLAGVLVIAFPVSVFSDLWSDELKEIKGFDDLMDDDIDDDEEEEEEEENKMTKQSGEPKRRVRRLHSDHAETDAEIKFLSKDSRYIVMETEDLNDIVASLHTIQDNQRQIKRILKKYYNFEK